MDEFLKAVIGIPLLIIFALAMDGKLPSSSARTSYTPPAPRAQVTPQPTPQPVQPLPPAPSHSRSTRHHGAQFPRIRRRIIDGKLHEIEEDDQHISRRQYRWSESAQDWVTDSIEQQLKHGRRHHNTPTPRQAPPDKPVDIHKIAETYMAEIDALENISHAYKERLTQAGFDEDTALDRVAELRKKLTNPNQSEDF